MGKIKIKDITPKEITLNLQEQEFPECKVSVIHDSDDRNNYASFQLRLIADYREAKPKTNWYKIEPEISSLIPAGALVEFSLKIIDTPIPNDIGVKINIDVEAFSPDWPDKDRKKIDLIIQRGNRVLPVEIKSVIECFPKKADISFEKSPGEEFYVSVDTHNPNHQKVRTNLRLELDDLEKVKIQPARYEWELEEGNDDKIFTVKIPPGTSSRDYQLKVLGKVLGDQESVVREGKLKILPQGSLNFNCDPKLQQTPARVHWKFWRSDSVKYQLIWENNSNVDQQIEKIEVRNEDNEVEITYPLEQSQISPEETSYSQNPLIRLLSKFWRSPSIKYELGDGDSEEKIPIAQGDTKKKSLSLTYPRPWLGQDKFIERTVHLKWSNPENLDIPNQTQEIALLVKPVIPFWLQIIGPITLLCLFWWLFFKLTKHSNSVNSVQFNGVGEEVISGSSDQSVIAWRVDGFNPFKFWAKPKIQEIAKTDKAVRVVRYRPVDNNLVAVGLENGEIQVWDWLSESAYPKYCFSDQKDDRVFALEFSDNAHYLFSGHGSGRVNQWDLTKAPNCSSNKFNYPNGLVKQQKLNFAISSLKFIGHDQKNLIISGRYNSLSLWSLSENQIRPISDSNQGGEQNYIQTLATAEFNPYLLATGDNQGHIKLWNLQNCLENSSNSCTPEIRDSWNVNQAAINTVALDSKGCYLVSGGADGKVMLWPLLNNGQHSSTSSEIDHSDSKINKTFNSVDIKVVKDEVLIVSGNDDSWVRLNRKRRMPELGCDRD